MRKLLMTTALAVCMAGPAFADPVIVTFTGTPDPIGQNFGTINGAAFGSYSGYAGPLSLNTDVYGSIIAFCLDLNHTIASTSNYNSSALGVFGNNQPLTAQQIADISYVAGIGFAANLSTASGQAMAAAAQIAIWDIAYAPTNSISLGINNATVANDFNGLMAHTFSPISNPGFQLVELTPGAPWPNGGSQALLVQVAAVPEPATWAMMLLGFAGIGLTALRKGGRKFRLTSATA
jgi:hypothetical protein